MTYEIVQLLPRLDGHGVASHARQLASSLESGLGMRTRFVVAHLETAASGDSPTVVTPDADSLQRHLGDLGCSRVLVHYSNYGYAVRGCPRWLLDGLARWNAQTPDGRLVTTFHELYARGRLWQSSFWLWPVQRSLARRMHRMSAASITSVPRYAEELRGWDAARPTAELPVFSTVGEPIAAPPLGERAARIVVFGSAGLRGRAYAAGLSALGRTATILGAREILDIGAGAVAPARVGQVPVRVLGQRTDAEVSALLTDSVAGFLVYPSRFLEKSTVFAALCAHRTIPVLWWHRPEPTRAFAWSPEASEPADWQRIADSAVAWYRQHALAAHVRLYGTLLA